MPGRLRTGLWFLARNQKVDSLVDYVVGRVRKARDPLADLVRLNAQMARESLAPARDRLRALHDFGGLVADFHQAFKIVCHLAFICSSSFFLLCLVGGSRAYYRSTTSRNTSGETG